jgi:hypothetical protein
LPNWATAGAPGPVGATALPAELIGDLIRLVRLGHLQGVQAALEAAIAQRPQGQAELRAMRLLAERFELDALLDRLTQALRDLSTEAL